MLDARALYAGASWTECVGEKTDFPATAIVVGQREVCNCIERFNEKSKQKSNERASLALTTPRFALALVADAIDAAHR